MAVLDRGCCCLPLKTAGIVIAIFSGLGGAGCVAWSLDLILRKNMNYATYASPYVDIPVYHQYIHLMYVYVVLYVLYVIACICLLVAALKAIEALTIPYLIGNVLSMLFFVVNAVFYGVMTDWEPIGVAIHIVSFVVGVSIQTYQLLCVLSLYQQTRKENIEGATTSRRVIYTQNTVQIGATATTKPLSSPPQPPSSDS